MKKLLSLALSIAMIMSIAVVALAADANYVDPIAVIDTNTSGDGPVASYGTAYFKYDTDLNRITTEKVNPGIAYGNKVYFPLVNAGGYIVGDADAVKSMTVKADWELGEDLVKSISVVKKRFHSEPSVYGYFVEVSLNSSALETASDDLVGTLTVKKSTGDYKLAVGTPAKNYFDFDVNIPIVYGDPSSMSVITDSAKLFNFDQDEYADEDEYELTFAEIPDATFTVDVTSQGKIILKATGDYNATVAAQYPLANLDFFCGNGASFNKIGELFLPADEGTYLYVLNSDGTLSSANAEYDSYEEGFYVKTRTLGTYVISDAELDLSAAAPAEEPAVDDVVEAVDDVTNANPGTGAAA